METEKIYREMLKEDRLPRQDMPKWLDSVSKAAYEDFQKTGLPHAKLEAWKYVPTESILLSLIHI